MAHPKREAFVEQLQQELPEAEVVWDEMEDRWDTGRRAWLAQVDSGSDYSLVVQDDALICQDLLAGLAKAADVADGKPICLYTGRARPKQHTTRRMVHKALRLGTPWIELPGPWWGVGIALPTAHITNLIEWADDRTEIENYDMRIEHYYEAQEVPCLYTLPSLVEHRPVAENPSLVEGRIHNRQAWKFLGTDTSALTIDWDIAPVTQHTRIKAAALS
jgi:hypothetical protein